MLIYSKFQIISLSIWIIISIASIIFDNKQQLFSRKKLLITTLICSIDIICIISIIVTHGSTNWKYFPFVGAFILLLGILIPNKKLLLSITQYFYKLYKLKPIKKINFSIGRLSVTRFSGDIFQMIGFALLWQSSFFIVMSIITIFLIIEVIRKKQIVRIESNPNNETLKRFGLPKQFILPKYYCALLFFILFIVFITAVINRDIILFHGTIDDATSLLSILIQVEVTFGTLVITSLFVFIELTSSIYSSRFSSVFSKRPQFKLMLFVSILSIISKIYYLSSFSQLEIIPLEKGQSIIVDGLLIYTIVVGYVYYLFIKDSFSLLSTEKMVNNILENFDNEWMKVIRNTWADNDRYFNELIQNDPLILIERILISALKNNDFLVYDFTLRRTCDQIMSIYSEHDGNILDNYLYDRFYQVILTAGDLNNEKALEYLSILTKDIVTPSLKVFTPENVKLFSIPPSNNLLRKILEISLLHNFSQASHLSLIQIEKLCTQFVSILPKYSDLWLYNNENFNLRNIDENQRRIFVLNDGYIGCFIYSYIKYFHDIGKIIIDKKIPNLLFTLSNSILVQVDNIVDKIEEEGYQKQLISRIFLYFEDFIIYYCNSNISDEISFFPLGYISVTKYESVANTICAYISRFLIVLAEYGKLDTLILDDITLVIIQHAEQYPDIYSKAIPLYGEAGVEIVEKEIASKDIKSSFIINSIIEKIDHLEKQGSIKGYKTKTKRAASHARAIINEAKRSQI